MMFTLPSRRCLVPGTQYSWNTRLGPTTVARERRVCPCGPTIALRHRSVPAGLNRSNTPASVGDARAQDRRLPKNEAESPMGDSARTEIRGLLLPPESLSGQI